MRHMCISVCMLCRDVCVYVYMYERGPLHGGLYAQTGPDNCMQTGFPCKLLWTKAPACLDSFSFLKALSSSATSLQHDCPTCGPGAL